jgi:hypothetical protein
MIIPKKVEFTTANIDHDLFQSVLEYEEGLGFKKSVSFSRIFNLGLETYHLNKIKNKE